MARRRYDNQLKGTQPVLADHAVPFPENGLPNFAPSEFIPPNISFNDSDQVSIRTASAWVRAGNILGEGIAVPKDARAFFEKALGTAADGHTIAVFDKNGRLTKEAAAQIGAIQDKAGIFNDKKMGRETFNALFDPNTTSPVGDVKGQQCILHDFANAFYQKKGATVRPGHDGVFDMNDPRATTFREGLKTLQDSLTSKLMSGATPQLFGKNGALTAEQAKHVQDFIGAMLKKPGQLTADDVKAFQHVLQEVGFTHGRHPIQANGAIDAATAQGLMNFAMMNGTLNLLQDTQTILASNQPKPTRGAPIMTV